MNEDQEILEYLKGVLSAEQELALTIWYVMKQIN